ncbi:MAG TPA: hypothetical protein PKC20_06415 [Burkholderiaceae bacterium]|nr:hypothetical protein [Burkholderiaceae bacterium]
MDLERPRVEVLDRRRVEVEVPEPVDAAHQRRAQPLARDAPAARRHVADAQPDPAVVRAVRHRMVVQERVVQRELAGREHHRVGRRALGHLERLPGREQVRRVALDPVRHLPVEVAARHHPHAAALQVAAAQRDPGGHVRVRRVQPEVGRVLVPADERVGARLLRPQRQVVDEDVRPDQRLDRVEHPRLAHDPVDPAQVQVHLASPLGWQPEAPLAVLEPIALDARPRRVERDQRAQVAVAAVAVDLCGGQRHAYRCAGTRRPL